MTWGSLLHFSEPYLSKRDDMSCLRELLWKLGIMYVQWLVEAVVLVSFLPFLKLNRFENSLLVRVLVSLCPLCDAVQHGIVFGWGVLGFPFVWKWVSGFMMLTSVIVGFCFPLERACVMLLAFLLALAGDILYCRGWGKQGLSCVFCLFGLEDCPKTYWWIK